MRIRWDELEPHTYESLVANLLGQIHHDVERIDGSGGDDGLDVVFDDGQIRDIYQLKSYTGRMSEKGRRTKIKKDLEKAKKHKPRRWFLVVPIDPTPNERRWFKRITKDYEFKCEWRGLNWLEARMAEHPELVRYAQGSTNDEVVALLKELHREDAAIESVDDATHRVAGILSRLNEMDPFYAFEIASDGSGARVTAKPRYVDAHRDSPIGGSLTVTGRGEKSREAAAALQEMYDFGLSEELVLGPEHEVHVEMETPGGLGRDGLVESLTLKPANQGEDFAAALRVLDGDQVIASLPIVLTPVSSGRRGGKLVGSDRSGALQVRMRFDTEEKRVTFDWSTKVVGSMPAEVFPILSVIRAAATGTQLQVVIEDGSELFRTELGEDPWGIGDAELGLINELTRLQNTLGIFFPIPEDLSAEDEMWISVFDRLLQGEVVEMPWSERELGMTVRAGATQHVAASLAPGPSDFRMVNETYTLEIDGNHLTIGPVEIVIPAAVIVNLDDVNAILKDATDTEETSIVLRLRPTEPAGEHPMQLSLLRGS